MSLSVNQRDPSKESTVLSNDTNKQLNNVSDGVETVTIHRSSKKGANVSKHPKSERSQRARKGNKSAIGDRPKRAKRKSKEPNVQFELASLHPQAKSCSVLNDVPRKWWYAIFPAASSVLAKVAPINVTLNGLSSDNSAIFTSESEDVEISTTLVKRPNIGTDVDQFCFKQQTITSDVNHERQSPGVDMGVSVQTVSKKKCTDPIGEVKSDVANCGSSE
jgi:hypothetical protein